MMQFRLQVVADWDTVPQFVAVLPLQRADALSVNAEASAKGASESADKADRMSAYTNLPTILITTSPSAAISVSVRRQQWGALPLVKPSSAASVSPQRSESKCLHSDADQPLLAGHRSLGAPARILGGATGCCEAQGATNVAGSKWMAASLNSQSRGECISGASVSAICARWVS